MPLRVRAWILGVAVAAIVPLPILLIYAPPDGQQRAELAQFLGRFHPLAVHIPIALFLLVRWAVVAQVAAIDDDNWVEALKRSWKLTSGNALHVFGLLLLTGLLVAVLRGVGLSATGKHIDVLTVIVGIVIDTIARSFVALSTAVLFFDLVARAGSRA